MAETLKGKRTPARESGRIVSKPMSAPDLISCLAGELLTDPALLVETIKEDDTALAIVRQYGRGQITYEEVRDAVSAIC